MKSQLTLVLLLLGCSEAGASFPSNDMLQPRDLDTLSTNWVAEAKAALPSKYSTQDLSFQQLTNLLRQESVKGSNAAQALWGTALIVQSRSQSEADEGLELLRNSATNGYAPAMLQLGFLFQGHRHFNRDYTNSFHWFRLASEKGNAEAQLQLGVCYRYGLGTAADFELAAKYYRLSAEQTNYVAMKNLGYLLMRGYGVKKDLGEAKQMLLRAAQEGANRRAMFNLGVISSMSSPDTNAMAEAYRWYRQSAELGDALAMQALAGFYHPGWGVVETNLDTYRYWRSKAATSGATDAQFLMGWACRTGDGLPKDSQASLEWYRKAAAKHHPRALYDLALHYLEDKTNRASLVFANEYMLRAANVGHREAQLQCAMSYFRGDLGPPDFEGGKRWLAMAAENGWARAEFILFRFYYNGAKPCPECPRYPQNRPEAIKWLQRAADHESLEAQDVLAVMLIQGKDIDGTKGEAERLLRNVAEHGNALGQNDLGFAIQHGDTAQVDFVESGMWCQLSASHAADPNLLRRCQINLSNALSRLTVEQKLEVENRVKAFQARSVTGPDPMLKGWEENQIYEQEDGLPPH